MGHNVSFNYELEDTARYAGLLLAPAEGFGLWPRLFFALWAKKRAFYAVLAYFRCLVVTMVIERFTAFRYL